MEFDSTESQSATKPGLVKWLSGRVEKRIPRMKYPPSQLHAAGLFYRQMI
jgi:hypothetical protein